MRLPNFRLLLRAALQPTGLLCIAFILATWIAITFQLRAEYSKAESDAITRGDSLARLFEQDVTSILQITDRTLLLLRNEYEKDPQHFDFNSVSSIKATSKIESLTFAIIGSDGHFKIRVNRNGLFNGPNVDLTDRDYFRFHSASNRDELYVGEPVDLRDGSDPLVTRVIPLTRRLSKSDGGYDGVIATSLTPDFLKRFHELLRLAGQAAVTIQGLDGKIRASYSLTGPLQLTELLKDAPVRNHQGHFWGYGHPDGIDRMVSYRAIEGYPLIVIVGESAEHAFEQYRTRKTAYIAAAAALSVLLCFVIAFTTRRYFLLEQYKSSVEQTNVRFKATLENMSFGVSMFDGQERLIICNPQYGKIYGLPPELLKTGTPFQAILTHRNESGLFVEEQTSDVLTQRRSELRHLQTGDHVTKIYKLSDGRIISITRHPVQGGGWVTVHQDITEHNSLVENNKQRIEIDAAIEVFRKTVEANLGAVRDSSIALRSIASELSVSSTEASSQSDSALCESKSATTSVSSAATAAVELEISISEITDRLHQAAAVARNAVAETQTTNKEINELAQATNKIGDIVKFIQDIAEQTNLLALNATIEAARAGEAGRGFTIVASEVKTLAVQTAKATEEIAAQIRSVQGSADSSVVAIQKITKLIQGIDEYASAITSSIRLQRDATSEISRNVVSAADGTKMVSAALEQVAGTIVKSGISANSVLATTEAVEKAATNLRENVEDFLRKVAV